jgi:hypothetical protein
MPQFLSRLGQKGLIKMSQKGKRKKQKGVDQD